MKIVTAVCSGISVFLNPKRQEMLAKLAETTSLSTLAEMHSRMLKSKTGRRIQKQKPIVSSSLLKNRDLPLNSFGAVYLKYLNDFNLSPDDRAPVTLIDDEELAYVMLRWRQIHDYIHCLTGLNSSVDHEVLLKIFEYAHTGMPVSLLSSVFGPLLTTKAITFRDVEWAFRSGSFCNDLITVDYENLFDLSLDNVRKSLRIIPYNL